MLITQLENVVEIEIENEKEVEQSLKMLFIFPDKKKAEKETKELKARVTNREEVMQYIENKDYKVNLDRDDLNIIVEAAKEVPPFYKMAWENDIDRVIILK